MDSSRKRRKLTEESKEAKERYLVIAFIISVDRNTYCKLVEDLENQFTQGLVDIPTKIG